MTFLSLLMAMIISAGRVHGIPDFEVHRNPPPYRARWGPYIVKVIRVHDPNTQEWMDIKPRKVLILDRKGRTLRQIRGCVMEKVEAVRLLGKGKSELHIQNWVPGAYCCHDDAYLTYQGGLRTLVNLYTGYLGVWAVKDLDHDGHKEIIADTPVLGHFSGLHFGARPRPVALALKWHGRRYVDATRRFPRQALENIRYAREGMRDLLHNPMYWKDRREQSWRESMEDDMAYLYANAVVIGRERWAKRWLYSHVPFYARPWLPKHEKELGQVALSALQRYDKFKPQGDLWMGACRDIDSETVH